MSSRQLSLWGSYCAFQERLVFILSHTCILFRPVKYKNVHVGDGRKEREGGERAGGGEAERREAVNRKTKDAGRLDISEQSKWRIIGKLEIIQRTKTPLIINICLFLFMCIFLSQAGMHCLCVTTSGPPSFLVPE